MLGAVVGDCHVALAVRVGGAGDAVVCAAYIPQACRGYAQARYCDVWDGFIESSSRLAIRHGIAEGNVVYVGDMNARVGALPCGEVPVELQLERRGAAYSGFRV